MSETKVQIPALKPSEYRTLMDALEFYHSNEKAVAVDKDTDLLHKSRARTNAVASESLIKKIG